AETDLDFKNYPQKLTFKSHDPKLGIATFTAGAAVYTVEVDDDINAKLKVRLECGAKIHIDRIDLASEAQRKRFSESGAMRTQVPFEAIEAHLYCLIDEVQKLQAQLQQPLGSTPKPVVVVSDADRQEA